jgi:hypothetical protein
LLPSVQILLSYFCRTWFKGVCSRKSARRTRLLNRLQRGLRAPSTAAAGTVRTESDPATPWFPLSLCYLLFKFFLAIFCRTRFKGVCSRKSARRTRLLNRLQRGLRAPSTAAAGTVRTESDPATPWFPSSFCDLCYLLFKFFLAIFCRTRFKGVCFRKSARRTRLLNRLQRGL